MHDSEKPPLAPMQGDSIPFSDAWHIRQVDSPSGTRFEVRDSAGAVVAADIRHVEYARMFAFAPSVLSHFDSLRDEAERTLNFMVDVPEGLLDIHEVAEDVDGKWVRTCSDAPRFAGWLLDMHDLRASIGHEYPQEGVARQASLELGVEG